MYVTMETCCTWLMVSYFVIKICHVVLSLCCCFFYEKKKKLENNHEYVQIQDGMVWNADCERWKLDGNYIVEKRQCVVLFPFFLPSSVAHRLLLSWSPIPHCNFSLTLLAVLKLNRMCMTAWHVYVFYLAYIHIWKQQNNTAHGICLMKSEQMTITFNFYLFAFSFFLGLWHYNFNEMSLSPLVCMGFIYMDKNTVSISKVSFITSAHVKWKMLTIYLYKCSCYIYGLAINLC